MVVVFLKLKKIFMIKMFYHKKNFYHKKIYFRFEWKYSKLKYWKKNLKDLKKKDLIEILECGYCQKTACQSFYNKFLVSCKFCRENICKKCHKFDTTKEILLKEVDTVGKSLKNATKQHNQHKIVLAIVGVALPIFWTRME